MIISNMTLPIRPLKAFLALALSSVSAGSTIKYSLTAAPALLSSDTPKVVTKKLKMLPSSGANAKASTGIPATAASSTCLTFLCLAKNATPAVTLDTPATAGI